MKRDSIFTESMADARWLKLKGLKARRITALSVSLRCIRPQSHAPTGSADCTRITTQPKFISLMPVSVFVTLIVSGRV